MVMEFRNREELNDFLNTLKYVGEGIQGQSLLDKKTNQVYKIFSDMPKDIQENKSSSEEKELQLEKDEINTLEQTKNQEETQFIDNSQIALANGKIIDNKLPNKIYIIIL